MKDTSVVPMSCSTPSNDDNNVMRDTGLGSCKEDARVHKRARHNEDSQQQDLVTAEPDGEQGGASPRSTSLLAAQPEHISILTQEMLDAQAEAELELRQHEEKVEVGGEPSGDVVVPVLLKASGLTADDHEAGHGPAAAADAGPKKYRKAGQLDLLLQKADAYNSFILGKLQQQQQSTGSPATATPPDPAASGKGKRGNGRGGKRKKGQAVDGKGQSDALGDAAQKMSIPTDEGCFDQPLNLVGGSLKSYQLEGLTWLARLWMNGLNGILADEMGLGKTIQVIGLFGYLRLRNVYGPHMVVAPLATLPNWVLEIRKWLPSAPVLLYHGSKQEREVLRQKHLFVGSEGLTPRHAGPEFPIVITSYELAQIDRKYLARHRWKWLIVDEGQRIKNRNGRLFKELKEYPSESRLLLSGTPIQNSLEELWTLLNFCQPNIFDDLDIFRGWFGFHSIGKETTVEQILDEEHRERVVTKLHEILRPFLLRRLKKDVDIELPEKKEIVIYANMSRVQRDYYQLAEKGHLRDALVAQAVPEAERIKQTNPQMLLRKICNHPFLVGEPVNQDGELIGAANPEVLIQASGKLKLLDRMLLKLKKGGHRVLLFSQMTELLTVLEDYLRYRKWRYCRIDGSVKVEDRQTQIEEFNKDKNIFVFLLSTRAGGLGINLAGADSVILYDSDWNPHADSQAQDRCHRIGQTKNVIVYRLLTIGSVEIEMMESQMSKKKLERLSIVGGDYRKAGRRSRGEITTEGLRQLLQDDVKDLQRMSTSVVSEKDISEEELSAILDRENVFREGGIKDEGDSYDVVKAVTGDLLSEISGAK